MDFQKSVGILYDEGNPIFNFGRPPTLNLRPHVLHCHVIRAREGILQRWGVVLNGILQKGSNCTYVFPNTLCKKYITFAPQKEGVFRHHRPQPPPYAPGNVRIVESIICSHMCTYGVDLELSSKSFIDDYLISRRYDDYHNPIWSISNTML